MSPNLSRMIYSPGTAMLDSWPSTDIKSFSSLTVGLKFGAAINASDIMRTNKQVAG